MIGKIVRYSLLRERRSSAVSRPKGMCLFARELRPITGGGHVIATERVKHEFGWYRGRAVFRPFGTAGCIFLLKTNDYKERHNESTYAGA